MGSKRNWLVLIVACLLFIPVMLVSAELIKTSLIVGVGLFILGGVVLFDVAVLLMKE